MFKPQSSIPRALVSPITEELVLGTTVISAADDRPLIGKIIYLDNYGGRAMWEKIKAGDMPPHHLRGCIELAKMGYKVALAEPLPDFYLRLNAFPHDLKLLQLIRNWLGPDGIIFCGHNVLYWTLLLKRLGLLKCRIVSNLWAREPLNFAKAHTGIVALTKAGADQARKLAPNVPVAPLGWGADLSIYPSYPYKPEAFFSCGIALRDFKTLSLAASKCSQKLEIVVPGEIDGAAWPQNVKAIDSGKGWNFENKRLTYNQLLQNYYSRSAASLIIVKRDDVEYTACGFTEIIEALAMARPVILTRAGALPGEIDVEKHGCGIIVPPEDPDALAQAIDFIGKNPEKAEEMGSNGRKLAESYYNIDRFARDLHEFFQTLD